MTKFFRRSPNYTDILRLFGAFCIIWYHIDYYWSLGAYTPFVDVAKMTFISWAMPFFYVTASRYAIERADNLSWSYFVKRQGRMIFLLLFWACIYSILKYRGELIHIIAVRLSRNG